MITLITYDVRRSKTSNIICDERDPAFLKNSYTIPYLYLTLCVPWLDLTWYVLLTF